MSGEPSHVLVIGEALVDVVHRGDEVSEHVGGSPANVAMGLARLEHPTTLAACIGDDDRGRAIAEHLVRHGVELSPGSIRPRRSSTAQAVIADDGSATYTFDIAWDPALDALPAGVGHVHTGSLATAMPPGSATVAATLASVRATATISYDPNIRPAVIGDVSGIVGDVEAIIAGCTLVKASDEDVDLLYPGREIDEVLSRWLDLGAALAVVTRGPDGVSWASVAGHRGSAPTRAPHVADTVGAGDSFMAGLVSALLDADLLGSPQAARRLRSADADALAAAICRGLATSGITVSRTGAYAPTRAEIT